MAATCWVLVVVTGLIFDRPFRELETMLLDARMRLPHPAKASDDIIYVEIDDATITLLGRWPWSRSQMAEVIRALSRPQPAGMFVDIVFPEETTTSDDLALVKAFEEASNIAFGVGAELFRPGEKAARDFPADPILNSFCYDHKMEDDTCLLQAGRTVTQLPSLMAVASEVGHISFIPDDDGVVRRLPIFINMDGRYFPSVTFEIARRMLGAKPHDVTILPGKRVIIGSARRTTSTGEGEISIPVDSQTRILINFAGAWGKAFKHYPLHSILRNLLSEDEHTRRQAETLLEGKFIIVAMAGSGATDMGPTPLEPLIPLSEIHGHVISSIVNQAFLRIVPSSATLLMVLPVCLVLGFLSRRLGTLHFLGFTTCSTVLLVLAAVAAFSLFGLVVDIVWPSVAIILSYGGCAGYAHWKTERERAALRNAFSHYVSPSILSQVLEHPSALKLGGERLNLSILVLVLEHFERFSENAEPEEVFELLSSVYEVTCDCIFRFRGTIDKFTKDGLIAFFGAPIRETDHACLAARAALSIRHALGELAAFRSESGKKTVGAKMAINTGFATVGNLGSSQRMDYAVIGKNVNLCVRLAEAATEGQIVATRKTFDTIGDAVVGEECGEIRLPPYPKPFFIHNVLHLKETVEPIQTSIRQPATGLERKKYLGPYTLLEKLGVGNTGTVYRGYDEQLDRPVAIKVLFPALKKDRIRQITEEAKILAKLSHPNIVQVYYVGEEDGIGFLAMEYVEGSNLRELLNTEGSLAVSDAIDIVIQTCRGLNAAHRKGILHRDIKPANLLISNNNVTKIADFGLAESITSPKNKIGRVAGTFQYISPEQARGDEVDCRSDIYSLGITFFHLLVNEPPFQADTIPAMIWLHTDSELPVTPLRQKEAPECVISLIKKMTEKNPAHRFSDYLELLRELDAVERKISD